MLQTPTAPQLQRHYIAGVPVFMTKYGEAIRERREWVGFSTATDCAKASEQLALDEPGRFKKFSQSSLSRWELDKTGQHIQGAHGTMLRTLSYLLKWTSDEFAENVGVPIGKVPYLDYGVEGRHTELIDGMVLAGGLVMVGVLGVANGGRPDSYGIPVDPRLIRGGNTRSFKVEGNSMDTGKEDGIKDGDWVLVDISLDKPANGRVFLLEIIGDGYTVKRLRQLDGVWRFLSDNPESSESWRPDQVRIIGQVYGGVDYKEIH